MWLTSAYHCTFLLEYRSFSNIHDYICWNGGHNTIMNSNLSIILFVCPPPTVKCCWNLILEIGHYQIGSESNSWLSILQWMCRYNPNHRKEHINITQDRWLINNIILTQHKKKGPWVVEKSYMNFSMSNNSLVNLLKQSKPYLAVILLQFGYAGSSIITKYALDKGVNHYTFVLYANAIAGIFFAPFALFFERYKYMHTYCMCGFVYINALMHINIKVWIKVEADKFLIFQTRKRRPKLTPSIFLKIFVLGLLEYVEVKNIFWCSSLLHSLTKILLHRAGIDQNLFYAGMQYTTATFATALCNILPAITFVLAWILRYHFLQFKPISMDVFYKEIFPNPILLLKYELHNVE